MTASTFPKSNNNNFETLEERNQKNTEGNNRCNKN